MSECHATHIAIGLPIPQWEIERPDEQGSVMLQGL